MNQMASVMEESGKHAPPVDAEVLFLSVPCSTPNARLQLFVANYTYWALGPGNRRSPMRQMRRCPTSTQSRARSGSLRRTRVRYVLKSPAPDSSRLWSAVVSKSASKRKLCAYANCCECHMQTLRDSLMPFRRTSHLWLGRWAQRTSSLF